MIFIAILSISVIGSLYFTIVPSILYPPGPHIEWEEIWGGIDDDILYEMVTDSSGFFYLAGETWSYGNGSSDIFIVKMNKSFSQYHTWGGLASEEFSEMVIDSNDNIYIAGNTLSYGVGKKNVFLLKYNKSFTLEWNRMWDVNSSDSCNRLALDSLDNIYITNIINYPYYDVFLAKCNSSGDLQWNRTWSTKIHNITEEVVSIIIDSSDHIFLGVNTNITGSEWFLLKYNSSGTLLLNTSFNKEIPLELLVIDTFDNLYAAGSYNDMYLTKFDNNGIIEWNITCIEDVLIGTEVLAVDPFDNIVILGNELINASAILYGYNITDYDTYLMKFNTSGILNWNHTISLGNNIYPDLVVFDPSGNIFIGGSLELIAPGSLSYSIIVYDYLGNRKRSEGGGCEYGDGFCKGIYAESLDNFYVAINSPCLNEEDYDIGLIKYIEPINYYPYDPFINLVFLIIFNSLFYISCIIGVIYLILRRKKRLKQ